MLKEIPITKLYMPIFNQWDNQWFLLTCGDYESKDFNTMTVSWGSMGIMWHKPIVMVVVRPVRYTFNYMEKYNTFSLCTFSKSYKKALNLLGTRSGRDGNKIEASGLNPAAGQRIAAPSFSEAELVLECKKIYWDDFKPDHFLTADIDKNYPQKDYHRIYFGEVLGAKGVEKYFKE
jgi:flavin reductase (DIM6/NTAB) family NADH-FMN oxidoreductase RutF